MLEAADDPSTDEDLQGEIGGASGTTSLRPASGYVLETVPDRREMWAEPPRPSLGTSERQILLVLLDLGTLSAFAVILWRLQFGPTHLRAAALPLLVAWPIAGHFSGLYDIPTIIRLRACVSAVIRAGLAVTALLLALFFLQPFILSRSDVLILSLGAPLLILGIRLAHRSIFERPRFQRRMLIIGAGHACEALLDALELNHGHGLSVVGLLDDDERKHGRSVGGARVLGDCSLLCELVSSLGVEEVVLAINRPVNRAVLDGIAACYERGIVISLMPHIYEQVSGQVPVDHMGPTWLGAVPLSRSGGRLHLAIKRLMDIAISGIALLVAAPVMVLVAVLVRISSPGPILFRQARYGLHGHAFNVLKFRTMVDSPRIPDRHRVTSVGKWLRRMHLDELPQLFCILRGDMSLVGPRPKRADQARELEDTVPLYRARYRMRPGLTGWAQIRFRYAQNPDDEMAKLRYDLYYIKNHSLLLDISILIRTAAHVLGMRGF